MNPVNSKSTGFRSVRFVMRMLHETSMPDACQTAARAGKLHLQAVPALPAEKSPTLQTHRSSAHFHA